MSKLDIGVGDEFPLDESRGESRHARRHRHGHHHDEHRHGRFHHHRGRHTHRIGRLASLLVIAGVVALIVEHRLSADMAYGLIGAGIALLVLNALLDAVLHRRHHRHAQQQAS